MPEEKEARREKAESNEQDLSMLEEKEQQLQKYASLSTAIKEALDNGSDESVPALLERREDCIVVINQLDADAGRRLLNEPIENLLRDLAALDKEIRPRLQQAMNKLARLVQLEENSSNLRSPYEELQEVPKGVFYDRRK